MMMKTSRFLLVFWLAIAIVATPLAALAADGTKLIDQARALAGGLTPGDAAGFPVTISQSGSYRLSGNLTVPNADTTAIEVTADYVTIDLNGFAILGPTECTGEPTTCVPTGTGDGIHANSRKAITVLNGKIAGMGSSGVALEGLFPADEGAIVRGVQSISNGQYGIRAVSGATVSGNVARRNGAHGIFVDLGTVSGNTATSNGGDGIKAGGGGTVTGNTVVGNDGDGIEVGHGLVSGNAVLSNAHRGLFMGQSTGYLGNTLIDNGAAHSVEGGFNLGQNVCGTSAARALCP
jgi:parallel beta-helix repeat protein